MKYDTVGSEQTSGPDELCPPVSFLMGVELIILCMCTGAGIGYRATSPVHVLNLININFQLAEDTTPIMPRVVQSWPNLVLHELFPTKVGARKKERKGRRERKQLALLLSKKLWTKSRQKPWKLKK